MALPPGSEYFDLSDYIGVLRRRWVLVTAIALIGLALGGGYYYLTPKKYAATVLVQVNALPSNANQLGGRTGGPVNMDNEAQIVVSANVASIVKAKLHSPLSVTGLSKELHVAVPPNTTYLQITCTTGSADLAQKCANAFGKAYLYNRRTSSYALLHSEIAALDTQATQLENTIQKLKAETGKGGFPESSRKWGVAKLQLTSDITKLTTIQNKISAVTPFASSLAVANSPLVGQVVTPAITPFAPASPKKKLDLPSGLAGGLVVGLILAFLLEWRRPRLYTVRDVQRKADLPTVFNLADAKTGAQPGLASPRSPTGQTFTELAQYVGAALGDGHHVVMVTAAATDSGGAVAANLAVALARTRGETVLICADPRTAAIPRLLGPSDGRGFAELLAGTASLADVARETADLPALEVITPGLDGTGAVYDMQYDKVQRVMRDLRQEVRYVIIDVPSPGVDADTFSVAEFADAAILVMYAGTARSADVNDCLQRLDRLRTTVLAAVLLPSGSKSRRGRRSQVPVDEPYLREPMARPPVVREPLVREPLVREPLVREPLVREPLVREPLVREPLVREAAEPAGQAPYAYSTPAPVPQAQTRAAESRLPEVRYSEPLYSDPLYSDPRPSEPRHPETRAAEPRFSDPRHPEPRPAEPRHPEPRAAEPRHPEPRQPEARVAESRPPELRLPESRPPEPRLTEQRVAEPRPADPRGAEPRRPEPRRAETRPSEPRHSEPRHSEPRRSDPRSPEARPAEPRKPESRQPEPRLTEPRLTEPRPTEPRLAEPRQPEPRPTEPRLAEPRPTEGRPAEARPTPSFKPHPKPPQVQPVTRDESSTPAKSAGPPVLRPVAGRRASAQGGTSSGSRHAAPSTPTAPSSTEDSGQPANAGFSAWRPRNVSESWPLPTDGKDENEESGTADPPSGSLNAWYDRY